MAEGVQEGSSRTQFENITIDTYCKVKSTAAARADHRCKNKARKGRAPAECSESGWKAKADLQLFGDMFIFKRPVAISRPSDQGSKRARCQFRD